MRKTRQDRAQPGTGYALRPISEELEEKRIKLTGHIFRSDDADPLSQVSYKPGSAAPIDIGKRRVGRPRQQWLYHPNALVHGKFRHTDYNGYDFQNESILQAAFKEDFKPSAEAS